MKIPKIASRAFTLIEVTLALGVAGFCLTTILGLLSVGLTSNQGSSEQTMSASIAKAVMADLRATPVVSGASATSPRFGITVPATGVVVSGTAAPYTFVLGGDSSVATGGKSLYRVAVAFATPQSSANQMTATGVRILVTWPALADPGANSWPVHYSGSCEVFSALDRN